MDTYEKKYNEALERARYILHTVETAGCAMHKDLLTEIFPELRESEDEKIRKEMIEFIQWSEDRGMTRHDFHQAKRPAEWIAWLEKQKINTEGDFGRGYDCGYQAGYAVAMNEMKQKVATATLDSEKQKEQEPDIELVQRSWYLEGYHDREFGKEPMWLITACDGGPIYELNPKYGEKLKEEQKPAWSEEDEKILEHISTVIDTNYVGADWQRMIDWLNNLRPSWKPSEEDEERLINTSISFLKDFADKGYENAVECIDWLKSKLNGDSGK